MKKMYSRVGHNKIYFCPKSFKLQRKLFCNNGTCEPSFVDYEVFVFDEHAKPKEKCVVFQDVEIGECFLCVRYTELIKYAACHAVDDSGSYYIFAPGQPVLVSR